MQVRRAPLFQHSRIKSEERASREEFYKKLIWVIDGTLRPTCEEQFLKALEYAEAAESNSLPFWASDSIVLGSSYAGHLWELLLLIELPRRNWFFLHEGRELTIRVSAVRSTRIDLGRFSPLRGALRAS